MLLPGSYLKDLPLLMIFIYFPPNSLAELLFYLTLTEHPI